MNAVNLMKAKPEGRQPGIQVIARAAAILRALSSYPDGMSLSAIAQAVALPRSTVQRIVTALETENMVESLGPSGGFRLGPALGQLIRKVQVDIITRIRGFLTELSRKLDESVCLVNLAGDKVYVVDCVISERQLRVVFPVGVDVSALHTAGGRVLLAELDEEELKALVPESPALLPPSSKSREAFLAELSRIKQSGFAWEVEEHVEGIASFAVALHTHIGNYAISVIAPATRATKNAAHYGEALRTCRAAIERQIGRFFRPE